MYLFICKIKLINFHYFELNDAVLGDNINKFLLLALASNDLEISIDYNVHIFVKESLLLL